ncbi:mitochondrial distribution and morphology proteins-domain-containing protein [Obelidium mucronatum]|nr:mitochondrial distribution and morphology proteins-domain-containing protein [Obelidium mucronatum]
MPRFVRLVRLVKPARLAASTASKEGASAYAPTLQQHLANERRLVARLRLRLRFFLLGVGAANARARLRSDEFAALFSWASVAAAAFALLATTTAASLFLLVASADSDDAKLRSRLARWLSAVSGVDVRIDAGVVPNWRAGTIQLNGVKVKCTAETWTRRVADQLRRENPALSDEDLSLALKNLNLNWTYWDLDIQSVNVSISLWRYFQGLGLVTDCRLTGVRGLVDRSHVVWDLDWVPSLREPTLADFSLESFVVDDLLVTVKNPGGFRRYLVLSFLHVCTAVGGGGGGGIAFVHVPLYIAFRDTSHTLIAFTKTTNKQTNKQTKQNRPFNQWLLYDIMCADSIVGAYDNCLFSVHKWASSPVGVADAAAASAPIIAPNNSLDSKSSVQKRNLGAEMSHLKINGLPINHFNTGVTSGPFSWITAGTIDVDFHFVFPQHQDDHQLFTQIKQEFESVKYIAMERLEKMKERHHSYSGPNAAFPLDQQSESDPSNNSTITSNSNSNSNSTSANLRKRIASLTNPKVVTSKQTGTEYIEAEGDPEETEDYKTLIETYSPREYPSRYTTTSNTTTTSNASSPSSSSSSTELKLAQESTIVNQSGAPQLIFMHWGICLNDLRASVPLSTPDISYMSNALIRPIVGFMNSHRVRIPITFEARTELARFDGSWDFFSAGIVDIVAEEIGRALTLLVLDERERTRHLKRIGLWSVQNATRNLMDVFDFVRGAEVSQPSL